MIEGIKMMESAINQKFPQHSFDNDLGMDNSHTYIVGLRPPPLPPSSLIVYEDMTYISGSQSAVPRNTNTGFIPNLWNQKLWEWVPAICVLLARLPCDSDAC